MIDIKLLNIYGVAEALHGMRNPMNSWNKNDTTAAITPDGTLMVHPGPNDTKLMDTLCKAGPTHRKFMRMMNVYVDITAPLYWWKEFDTYKVGTVANSCSTMHKIHSKKFTIDDFSHDQLVEDICWIPNPDDCYYSFDPIDTLELIVDMLNECRTKYLETNDKRYWWQMIQLLPSSYNQKRTVMLNYEVLNNIYENRKDHKLDEWRHFCVFLETLPYKELITNVFEE